MAKTNQVFMWFVLVLSSVLHVPTMLAVVEGAELCLRKYWHIFLQVGRRKPLNLSLKPCSVSSSLPIILYLRINCLDKTAGITQVLIRKSVWQHSPCLHISLNLLWTKVKERIEGLSRAHLKWWCNCGVSRKCWNVILILNKRKRINR